MRRLLLLSVALVSPVAGIEVWMRTEANQHIGAVLPSPREWAIVLGAPAKDGRLSAVLAARLDQAAALWREGQVKRLLVSGDDGRFNTDEVATMRAALLERGVPEDALVIDGGANRTYASMVRARALFQIDRAVVVTNAFHIQRAVYLARKSGIDAFGVPAEDRASLWRRTGWWVRERGAVVRAVYDAANAADAVD